MPPRHQGGGVDAGKWDDPAHLTLKYQVLRIADEVPPAELRAQFEAGAGTQYDRIKALGFAMDRDGKISRPDLGPKPIDIIHGDNSEYGWRDENAIKAPTPPGTTTPPATAAPVRIAQGLSTGYAPIEVETGFGGDFAMPERAAPIAEMPMRAQTGPALYGTSQTPTFRSLMTPQQGPAPARTPLPMRPPAAGRMTFADLYARGMR